MRTAPLIFSFSTFARSTSGREERAGQLGVAGLVLALPVQELVRDLLEALEAEVEAADHQERRHRPRRDRADGERGGDEDRLVDERALEDGPDDRQLPFRPDPGHLLGVEREVVPEDAGRLLRRDLREEGDVVRDRRRFLRGDLGQDRDVVEDGRDVVEEGEEAGAGHGRGMLAGPTRPHGPGGARSSAVSHAAEARATSSGVPSGPPSDGSALAARSAETVSASPAAAAR